MHKVEAQMYEGMENATVEQNGAEFLSVSLESLNEDFYDQTYGMADGTMGCASSPGGANC